MSWRISSSDSGERSVTISTALAVGQRPGEVAQVPVDPDGQRGAREPGPDRRGEVGAAGAVASSFAAAVGQLDLHAAVMLGDP